MAYNVGTAWITVSPSLAGFQSKVNAGVSTPLARAGETASKSFGSKFSSGLGRAAKVGGVVLAGAAVYGATAFAKSAVSLEAQFGKTMNLLAATTGAPKKDMKSLSDLALKMGKDTVFSASDASEAMLELARGGMKAATIEGGALKGTLTLAAAGQLSMAEAAAVTNKAMGQFSLSGKDAGSIAAALAGAANASSASVGDLSQALSAGGLAANSVGFSVQETTGILAAFSNAGLEGSDAGTSLKTMLDRLQPSSASSAKAMRELGVITEDGTNKFIKANGEYKSAAQIAQVLKTSTEDLTSSERKRLITLAFGSDAQRGATILAKEGATGIRDMTKATSDQDAAQKTAQASMKGTAGAIESMKGSIETAALAFGMAIKPVTKFAAGVVTDIANKAVPIFQDLGEKIRELVRNGPSVQDLGRQIGQAFAGIDWSQFARLGPALSEFGPAIRDAGKELPSLSGMLDVTGVVLKFAANNVDLLAKALPYLVAGFLTLKVAQGAANIVAIATPALRVAEIIVNRRLTVSNRTLAASVTGLVPANAAAATSEAANTGAKNSGILASVRSRAATIAKSFAEKASAVASKALAAATWLVNIALRANPIGIVVTALVALGAGLVVAYKKSETFRNIVNGAWDAIKKGASAAWDGIKAVFGWLADGLKSLGGKWDDFKQAIANAWDGIKTNVSNAANAVKTTLSNAWDAVKTGVVNAWDAVRDRITDAWSAIKTTIGNGIDAVRDFLAQRWENIKTNVSNVWDGIKTVLSNVWDWVKTALSNYVDTWKNILSNAWGAMKTVAGNAWDGIKNVISGGWDFIERVFGQLKDGILFIGDVFGGFGNTVGRVFDSAQDIVKGAVFWIVDKFLWMAESIVGAAASAFSWVPGIGDKLAGAERSIADFRAKVNAELSAIDDEAVHISVTTSQAQLNKVDNQLGRGSAGGRSPMPAMGGAGLAFKTDGLSSSANTFHKAATDATSMATDIAASLKKKLTPAPVTNKAGAPGAAGNVLPRGSYRIGMPWMGYPGHYGADYPANTGTPVYAPWSGRVSASYDIPGSSPYNNYPYASYGRLVKVAYNNGWSSLFAHLSQRLVRTGQQLGAGAMVGRVGTMGNSTGPHLHAEFSRSGRRVNPATLGLFDRGGLARGGGYIPKQTIRPERVLDDRQTQAFERAMDRGFSGNRMELVLDSGERFNGYVRNVAGGQFAAARSHEDRVTRMHR